MLEKLVKEQRLAIDRAMSENTISRALAQHAGLEPITHPYTLRSSETRELCWRAWMGLAKNPSRGAKFVRVRGGNGCSLVVEVWAKPIQTK